MVCTVFWPTCHFGQRPNFLPPGTTHFHPLPRRQAQDSSLQLRGPHMKKAQYAKKWTTLSLEGVVVLTTLVLAGRIGGESPGG